ncbi:hypothetical protein [Actinocorallia aurantiaca]|uniref:hypothetical protein n=1 Tax=Actinocorallia aurantiaca TaxID=46204 RepID=UPI0031E1B1C8
MAPLTETDEDLWQAPPSYAAELRELYGLECPPWWGTPRRTENPTLGPQVAKVMTALGYPPMPWQRYVLDVALELNPVTGLPIYREVGISVPRQQGKTQQILGAMTHRAMAWARQNITYAAQTRTMARSRWEDEFLATIEESRLAKRFRARKGNGNEAIICLKTRSRIGITANTEEAGHGPSLDMGIIDEAFAHQDDRLEQAFSPAMLTRPRAQLWWASAGGTEKSVWLNKKRAAGRELVEQIYATGEFPAVAYFEWYAPKYLSRLDPETWRMCLPALGHTVTEEIIRAELDKMEDAEFDRAYLNRTRKATPPPDPNVPREAWPKLTDKLSQASADIALAVDVSPLRNWASIGLASPRPDGRMHLELVDRRAGTDWVVPALRKLADLHNPIAIAIDVPARSPAGSLLDDLKAAGFRLPEESDKPKRGDLAVPRMGDVTAACGQFADSVRQGGIVHIGQQQLNAAINGARTRALGDAWAWHRRGAHDDITPLVATTLARWALLARLPLLRQTYDPLANIR